MGRKTTSNASRSAAKAGKTETSTFAKIPPVVGPLRDTTGDIDSLLFEELRNRDDEFAGPVPHLTGYDFCYPCFLDNADAMSEYNDDDSVSTSSETSYCNEPVSDCEDDDYAPAFRARAYPAISNRRAKVIDCVLPVPQKIYESLVEEEYLVEC